MDNVMLERIKDLLAKNDSIGIAVGKNPGIDQMAASLALYLALLQVRKKVTVVCSSEPLVEVSSLVGINKTKKSFEGGSEGDLTVSFPYKEGEIEKISYTLEEGKLNILIKAGENGLSFNEKDIEYKREGAAPGLVFVVGTPRISDLGTAFDMETFKDSKIINIDYKPENQGFGDIPLLGSNASSVSELMASLIPSLGLNIDVDIASNLLTGIIDATDNFQNTATSPLAFEEASLLLKKGAIRRIGSKLDSDFPKDAFFSPKPSFAKKTIGTAEKKEVKKDTVFAKSFSEPAENNPPDDWLTPKIYKGSTSV